MFESIKFESLMFESMCRGTWGPLVPCSFYHKRRHVRAVHKQSTRIKERRDTRRSGVAGFAGLRSQ